MESSVTSQISPKLYSADIKKLYKDDIDAQSELFEINIFNHILHIAPGKSIADEEHDKLVYFYVYAIKDEMVVANLGVYELHTDEQKLMYDISSFENLLLFDYYYTSPGVIKEFEITGKNNIFDYIQTHLTPDPKVIDIYNIFPKFLREHKESEYLSKHLGAFKKIISIIAKDIKTIPINEKLSELKDYCKIKSLDVFKLTLAILEPFYNVQFSFVDQGVSVSNLREKTPTQTFTPKQYVVVSIDQSFVSTSSTSEADVAEVLEDEEAEDDAEAPEAQGPEGVDDLEAEGEALGALEAPEDLDDGVGESKGESKAEEEGGNKFNVNFKPKIKPPTGTRIKLKPKIQSTDAVAESKQSKAESKESKAESKESKVSKAPSKKSKDVKEAEPLGSSLNYIPKVEPPKVNLRSKISKKPEVSTAPPLGSSLNYVLVAPTVAPTVKARSIISKKPEVAESSVPKVSLFETKTDSMGEAKPESKSKLRTKLPKQGDKLEISASIPVSASRSVSPSRRPTPAPRTKLRAASPAPASAASVTEPATRGPTLVPRGSIKPRRSLKSKTNPNKPS